MKEKAFIPFADKGSKVIFEKEIDKLAGEKLR